MFTPDLAIKLLIELRTTGSVGGDWKSKPHEVTKGQLVRSTPNSTRGVLVESIVFNVNNTIEVVFPRQE